jgi:ketosteroid isomerase-like protein
MELEQLDGSLVAIDSLTREDLPEPQADQEAFNCELPLVVSARGGVGEGKSIFPDGIKSGALTRTAFEISEPRVRLYGDVSLVTTKVRVAGTFGGKPFDVRERETDVLHWEAGGWKIVLTHETFEEPRSVT